MTPLDACDACLRRAWLVQRLGGRLEIARHEEVRLPEVLALRDDDLIAALGGEDARGSRASTRRSTRPRRGGATARAGLVAVCRHDALLSAAAARRCATRRRCCTSPASLGRLERIADEEARSVAIVGTRRASRDGLEVARALGRDLALAGVPVVSGMALGDRQRRAARGRRRRRAERRRARGRRRRPVPAARARGCTRSSSAPGSSSARRRRAGARGSGRSRRATGSSPASPT